MIFGFNTDVKHGDTIYHVQSEAREGELLLQTQVFVRGRCIGKKATSYASKNSEAQAGDSQKEQLLREQHRLVLDAIREGKLDNVLDHPEPEASTAALPPAFRKTATCAAVRITVGKSSSPSASNAIRCAAKAARSVRSWAPATNSRAPPGSSPRCSGITLPPCSSMQGKPAWRPRRYRAR